MGDERVADVRFDAERLIVDLADGRTIAVPFAGLELTAKAA